MSAPRARARFRAGAQLRLDDDAAGAMPLGAGADKTLGKAQVKALDREETAALTEKIGLCQAMLYARGERKVLLVLQGMDTAGKDGTLQALCGKMSPAGVRVAAFKAPTGIELAHDYLWRVHAQVPGRGELAIFNRSHYEDVLVPVAQDLIGDDECRRRYAQMRDFERMLAETGTLIVKVFLHISKDEQRRRLQERLDDPDKQWKFDPNDLVQRKLWDRYQRAYERAIGATDADHAPWYVVPADSKTERNLIVATLLLETLQELRLDFPAPDPKLSRLKVV